MVGRVLYAYRGCSRRREPTVVTDDNDVPRLVSECDDQDRDGDG